MFNLLLFKDVYFIKDTCSTNLLLILHIFFMMQCNLVSEELMGKNAFD